MHLRVSRLARRVIAALFLASPALAQTSLTVETDPAGAKVWIDGAYAGVSPVRREVRPGDHLVYTMQTGFAPVERVVTVAEGDSARVQLRLLPVSSTLRVEGLPEGARVIVEGVPLEDLTTLPVGTTLIHVEDGAIRAQGFVSIAPTGETVVGYERGAFDAGVFFRGGIVPGALQFSGGRPLAGAVYVGGMAATALTGLAFDARATRSDRDLEEAVRVYDAATSEAEVNEALGGIDAAYDAAVRNRNLRAAAFVAVGVVYVASLVDAGRHHSHVGRLTEVESAPPRVALAPTGSGVALRIAF